MKVIFSVKSQNHLRGIAIYIARDNKKHAQSFSTELRRQCQDLIHAPYGFPVYLEHPYGDVRCRPYGNYLIFYTVMEQTILIQHILHSARDVDALLTNG